MYKTSERKRQRLSLGDSESETAELEAEVEAEVEAAVEAEVEAGVQVEAEVYTTSDSELTAEVEAEAEAEAEVEAEVQVEAEVHPVAVSNETADERDSRFLQTVLDYYYLEEEVYEKACRIRILIARRQDSDENVYDSDGDRSSGEIGLIGQSIEKGDATISLLDETILACAKLKDQLKRVYAEKAENKRLSASKRIET
jgi:hypothetical protein